MKELLAQKNLNILYILPSNYQVTICNGRIEYKNTKPNKSINSDKINVDQLQNALQIHQCLRSISNRLESEGCYLPIDEGNIMAYYGVNYKRNPYIKIHNENSDTQHMYCTLINGQVQIHDYGHSNATSINKILQPIVEHLCPKPKTATNNQQQPIIQKTYKPYLLILAIAVGFIINSFVNKLGSTPDSQSKGY